MEKEFKPMDYFEPFWTRDGWMFRSKKTGSNYSYITFLLLEDVEKNPLRKVFSDKVRETSKYEMFSDFIVYWLNQLILTNALYEAEDAYSLFVINNSGKNTYKQANREYENAYQKYVHTYKDY